MSHITAASVRRDGYFLEEPLMLEAIVQTPFAISRHRATLFGPLLDDYLVRLSEQGHRRKVLHRNACFITLFGEYLAGRGVREVEAVTRAHVRTFGRSRHAWSCRASLHGYILGGFLRHLAERGHWHDDDPAPPVTLIDRFFLALVAENGLRPSSIVCYRNFVDQFVRHLHSDGSAKSLAQITTDDIDRFIVRLGRHYSRTSMGSACGAVRLLLRYLHREQVLDRDLSSAVLMPRFYALERIPCALPWKTVRRVLDRVDLSTACGRRDRAILLLLATYGLRPGEIVLLRLDDIDWRAETIRCRRIKPGRPLLFPLTPEVGEAIAAYLRRDRPPIRAREVFIRVDAPHVPLARGSIVSGIVRRALDQAGVESRRRGAYVLRHSLAVHLVRTGHPLKTVTDMLGHRDPRVAFTYTKLALEDLHGVALPAREVLP